MFDDSDYESDIDEASNDSKDAQDALADAQPPTKKLKRFEELLLKFIINTDQPLAIVDSGYFKQLVEFLNKHVDVPCRQTITHLIDAYYKKVKNEILFELASIENVCVMNSILNKNTLNL